MLNMNNITKNLILAPFNLLYKISPELELKLMFFLKQGYKLDLKNPKSFNEKISNMTYLRLDYITKKPYSI